MTVTHAFSETIKFANGTQFAVTRCGEQIHYKSGIQDGEITVWHSDVTCAECLKDRR